MDKTVTSKRIHVDDARAGIVLASPVTTPDGKILLEEGIPLTNLHLSLLHHWNVTHLSIQVADPNAGADSSTDEFGLVFGTSGLTPESEISLEEAPTEFKRQLPMETIETYERDEVIAQKIVLKRLRSKARMILAETINRLFQEENGDRSRILSVTREYVQAVMDRRHVFTSLCAVANYDNYLLDHVVNVAMLSLTTGYMMGMSPEHLLQLGEEAFLYDIGMVYLPEEIWNKEGKLTEAEMKEVRKHPIKSAEVIKNFPLENKETPEVIVQHHERWDGSGYPNGLIGSQIHEHARIIGMADVYQAMISPRKYRSKFLEYDAMRFLLGTSGGLFDPDVILAFLRHMSLYPIGSLVELFDGRLAVVVAANPGSPYRPWIRIVRSSKGEIIMNKGDAINLLNVSSLGIKCAASHKQLGIDPVELA